MLETSLSRVHGYSDTISLCAIVMKGLKCLTKQKQKCNSILHATQPAAINNV